MIPLIVSHYGKGLGFLCLGVYIRPYTTARCPSGTMSSKWYSVLDKFIPATDTLFERSSIGFPFTVMRPFSDLLVNKYKVPPFGPQVPIA